MTVTLLQQDVVWNNPAANQKAAEAAMLAAPKSDLYVLPEMWSTGFAVNPDGIAEHDGASLRWMKQMARRLNAAVAGSIATEADGKYYNRFFFVKPDACEDGEDVTFYDKRHLFTYGGENEHYTPGQRRVVIEWRDCRFMLQVCYDLRFPIFSRNTACGTDAYDAIIYVASWPASRRTPWHVLLHARAIENQCYVMGVNRTGDDPVCHYCGGTSVIDAYGNTVAECSDNEAASITVELDMERLRAFRKKFPVLSDRDV